VNPFSTRLVVTNKRQEDANLFIGGYSSNMTENCSPSPGSVHSILVSSIKEKAGIHTDGVNHIPLFIWEDGKANSFNLCIILNSCTPSNNTLMYQVFVPSYLSTYRRSFQILPGLTQVKDHDEAIERCQILLFEMNETRAVEYE
jgi:hypothetical protein